MSQEIYADVALRVRLRADNRSVMTYRVPGRLAGLVSPGQLIWAPLRQRRVQGVVLALRSPLPGEDAVRELLGLADPEAALTPLQLELAGWLADYYRAPLYDVLALMLPPGTAQEMETTWRASELGTTIDLGELPQRERAVLYYLRTHGETSERSLRSALRGSDAVLRDTYSALAGRSLVVRGSTISAPRARPQVERLARLLLDPTALPAALESLQRAPRQQAVLTYLANQPDPVAQESEVLNERAPAHRVKDVLDATEATLAALQRLEERGFIRLEQRERRRDPLAAETVQPDVPPQLSAQQQAAFTAVREALDASTPTIFLLHGVTGSGKTELYLRSIGRALRLGRQALVLVPEIALTTQLVRRFAARFAGQLAVLHSGLALGERYDEWRRLRRGEARIAIGSRSAVFAPLPELGLIIIDEEHEPSYKHETTPRYHARETALHLAQLAGAVLILGSATPSVESYTHAINRTYRLLVMPERVGASIAPNDGLQRTKVLPLPQVQLVDMRHELQRGNRSIFSAPLREAVAGALERNEQVLLFLNRRGSASFVLCRDCGHTITCPRCSSPLTVHLDEEQGTERLRLLVCHGCNHRTLAPAHCPECWSARIRHFGVGTQRVAEDAEQQFPGARVLRWDSDTVTGKDGYRRLLDRLLHHEVDLVVGTQMIAKGLDLPLITVVGVVAADMGLRLPDFRASERAFQLLTQVAGRAGRRETIGRVVIQSYNPDHYALQAAREHDYAAFYTQEIAFRRSLGYPPLSRLVRFLISGSSDERCEQSAQRLALRITELAPRLLGSGWGLVGPAPCFLRRLRGRFRWHLLLRTPDPTPLLAALGPLPSWIVDVDPVSVL